MPALHRKGLLLPARYMRLLPPVSHLAARCESTSNREGMEMQPCETAWGKIFLDSRIPAPSVWYNIHQCMKKGCLPWARTSIMMDITMKLAATMRAGQGLLPTGKSAGSAPAAPAGAAQQEMSFLPRRLDADD